MDSGSSWVLDSWALMEWIQNREPATKAVDHLLQLAIREHAQLFISRINYGEVLYSCWRKFPEQAAARILADVEALPIQIVEVTDNSVERAARIKTVVSASYADCFAAALAIVKNAPVVTGDPELRKIAQAFPLKLHWIGA